MVEPAQKREVVDYMVKEHSFCIRQACREVNLASSSYYYKPNPRDDVPIIDQLNKLSDLHPNYGFRKLFCMIRDLGFKWNKKRVHRVYKAMGLNIVRKRKRRLPVREKQHLSVPEKSNEVWSIASIALLFRNDRRDKTNVRHCEGVQLKWQFI